MSGIAPSVDQVAAPAPAPSAAEANAGVGNPTSAIPSKPEDDQKKDVPGGAGPAASAPKPVEVTSVPETPANTGTPAGGTPRPELNIPEEPPKEAPVVPGAGTSSAPKGDSAAVHASDESKVPNGTDEAAEVAGMPQADEATPTSEKRKAEEDPTTANGDGEKTEGQDEQRPEKKAKIADKISETVSDVKEDIESKTTGTNGSGKGKPGRPRKDKNAPPVVGKTERKTRSQGPVEAR